MIAALNVTVMYDTEAKVASVYSRIEHVLVDVEPTNELLLDGDLTEAFSAVCEAFDLLLNDVSLIRRLPRALNSSTNLS